MDATHTNWREQGVAFWAGADRQALDNVAALAGGRAREASEWLARRQPELAAVEAHLAGRRQERQALIHSDTRSDNLRWLGRRLYLLDWPAAMVGAPEDDVAPFVQSLTLETGLDPEGLLGWYAERLPVEDPLVNAALAAAAGYFCTCAWLPSSPELPRVRAFQRAQLRVTLTWLARRLGLPEPAWLRAVG